MAIQGMMPWEILKECIDECDFNNAIVSRGTGIDKLTMSKMTKYSDYSNKIVNPKFLLALEACGWDIKIMLCRSENPQGLWKNMPYEEKVRVGKNRMKKMKREEAFLAEEGSAEE